MGVEQILIQSAVAVDHISEGTSGHGTVMQSPSSGFGVNPLGTIIAIGNVAAWSLPASGAVKDGWALCNGQTFASLGAGNYNAAFSGTLPTLNDSRFLMGNASVGSTGGTNSNTLASGHLPSITTSNDNADHTHASSGTTATVSVDHVHTTNTAGVSANHVHNASAGTGGVVNGTAYYALITGSNTPATTSGQSVDHGHTGTSGGISANHTHTWSATSGGRSAYHQHTFGNASPTALENRPLYFSVVYLIRVK